MRFITWCLLLHFLLSAPVLAGDNSTSEQRQPIALEFSGYRFGQQPGANMVCFSGYCKSQAPGGDGRVTFPFSIYETPGAVSTLSGLTIVNPRYTFWEDRLFRILFQVDCTPLEPEECLLDIVNTLDREYGLTPLSANDVQQFTTNRHISSREFATDSGAFVKIRAATMEDGPRMPSVDIVDRGMANLVGSTLSPTYKPKKLDLQDVQRKP